MKVTRKTLSEERRWSSWPDKANCFVALPRWMVDGPEIDQVVAEFSPG